MWGGEAANGALTGKKDGKLNSSLPVVPVCTNFPDPCPVSACFSVLDASSSNTHLCESVHSSSKNYCFVTCLLAATTTDTYVKILTFYKCPTRPTAYLYFVSAALCPLPRSLACLVSYQKHIRLPPNLRRCIALSVVSSILYPYCNEGIF